GSDVGLEILPALLLAALPFASVLADEHQIKNAKLAVVSDQELPNAPGKDLRVVLVEYGPGGGSPQRERRRLGVEVSSQRLINGLMVEAPRPAPPPAPESQGAPRAGRPPRPPEGHAPAWPAPRSASMPRRRRRRRSERKGTRALVPKPAPLVPLDEDGLRAVLFNRP